MKRIRSLVLIVGVMLAATLPINPVAVAAVAPPITPHGVGALRLGATVQALHRQQLIGGLRKGCPFVTGQRVAPLRAPLDGWATFANGTRLTSFTIEGGAETGRHIGIGSTVGQARSAYPKAEWQPPRKTSPFFVGLLWVNSSSNPKMTFMFDPDTYRVDAIAVPTPSFCD